MMVTRIIAAENIEERQELKIMILVLTQKELALQVLQGAEKGLVEKPLENGLLEP